MKNRISFKPLLLAGLCLALGVAATNAQILNPAYKLEVEARYKKDTKELNSAKKDLDRFYALTNLAEWSVLLEKYGEAKKHADDLTSLIPKFKGNWNYGNAIMVSNNVLGLVALKNGNVGAAKKHLINAGMSPGSPQMNSFGPDMDLAKRLLQKGEKAVVIEYLDLCRRFWKDEGPKLDAWIKDINAGKMPDFGARAAI